MGLFKTFYTLGIRTFGFDFQMRYGWLFPITKPSATVYSRTADGNVSSANMGNIVNNTGASGTITLTLPAASGYRGYATRFVVTAAQILRIAPQTGESIYLNGSGTVSKYLELPAVVGNFADIYCDGSSYYVVNHQGVLTKEP